MRWLRPWRRVLALGLALLAVHALLLPLHLHAHAEDAPRPAACACPRQGDAMLHHLRVDPHHDLLCLLVHSGVLPSTAPGRAAADPLERPAPVEGASLTGRPLPAACCRGPPRRLV